MTTGEIRWWRTSFGREEVRGITQAIADEHISQGPLTARFESAFARSLGVPYAVATTSGSAALMMALMALGVGPGDEVILPNRTFVATAHAALLLGAKVVLVDVLPHITALDVSQVERRITRRTKAIMPVHLSGRAVDMAALRKVARKHGVSVVEDACQALFSRGHGGFLGTLSDAGCFSLGVTKLISTGQGGVVVTRSRKIYEQLKLVRNHGVADTFEAVYGVKGFNFKFTDLQASLGLVQLGRGPERVKHVKAVYSTYASALAGLPFLKLIPVNVKGGEVPLYVEVMCEEREPLRKFLARRGVQTRPFLPDLDRSPHLRAKGAFPHSRPFSAQGFFLPSGPSQSLSDVERAIEAIRSYGKRR